MTRSALSPVALLSLLSSAVVLLGSDWPQFRGPGGRGVSDESDLPVSWSDAESQAWKVELPGRGASSPIVVSGRVFLTANSGYRKDRLHVLSLDAETGAKLWERQFWATGRTACHPKTCMAAPTPASDGRRVFAFYSTNDLFCLDLDGNLLWLRGLTFDYPNATSGIGMASSPIVVGETLVVQVENQSDSFAAGIDVETGRNLWKIRRSPNPSWSTPVVLGGEDGAGQTLVLESWDEISGHDPHTGKELWAHGERCNCIPSPATFEGLILAPCDGLTALRPRGNGEPPEIAWRSGRLRPATASPLVHRGAVLVLSSAGILTSADASSGEVTWQLRLKGPFSSSPVAAGDHVYCVNEEGLLQVVRLGEGGELVGRHELGETILATPAIAAGGIYFRSDGHLWKFARPRVPAGASR